MHMKSFVAFFFLTVSMLVIASTAHSVKVGAYTRTYVLHVPKSISADKPVPLVLAYHGSGDTGFGFEDFVKFSEVADREGFIVAYPEAIGKNWNDGREAVAIPSQFNEVDDVSFTEALIADIQKQHTIDAKRIFATGFSNGGILVHLLGAKLTSRLAAIASVSGGIAEPFAPQFKPSGPLPVLIIHGSEDPFVPFNGGDVEYHDNGRIIGTSLTVKMWLTCNGITSKPELGELPDTNKEDQCHAKTARWSDVGSNAEVLLYTIEGGGHAWPNGPQFLPVNVMGRVCLDFDGAAAVWDFFKKHPKK